MKRVLLAEDNLLQSRVLAELFQEEGMEVSVVDNGLAALGLLNVEHFDIVVSDVNMPIANGFDLLLKIRKSEKLKDIPFVMYSSRPNVHDRDLAQEFNVTKYVEEAGIRGVPDAVMKILKP